MPNIADKSAINSTGVLTYSYFLNNIKITNDSINATAPTILASTKIFGILRT